MTLVAMLLAAGCGSSVSTASSTATPPELSAAPRSVLDDIELPRFEADCTEERLSGIMNGDVFLRARSVEVGSQVLVGSDPPVLVRELELNGVEVVTDPMEVAPDDDVVALWITEGIQRPEGEWAAMSGESLDLTVTDGMTDIFVSAVPQFDDAGDLSLMGLIGTKPGSSEALSPSACNATYQRIVESMGERLGEPDPVELLVAWTTAPDPQIYLDAENDAIDAMLPSHDQWQAWRESPPEVRGLDPSVVPPDVKAGLDVLLGSVQVTDLGEHTLVWFRTASGISGGVGYAALGVLRPVYLVPGRDDIIEVVVGDPVDQSAGQVVAAVPLAELGDAAGIEVTGSVADGTVAAHVLSYAEAAELLGTDRAGLDQIERDYLAAG